MTTKIANALMTVGIAYAFDPVMGRRGRMKHPCLFHKVHAWPLRVSQHQICLLVLVGSQHGREAGARTEPIFSCRLGVDAGTPPSTRGWIARSAVDPERRTPLFVKTAKQAIVSPLQGYLGVTNGDPVEVLYLGDQGDEQGWIYGRVLSTLREGWLPRSVVFDEAVEPLD